MEAFNVYDERPGQKAKTVVFGSFTLSAPTSTDRCMGLLDFLTSIFGSNTDRRRRPRETFRYRCRKCNTVFESEHRHVTEESCPRCGADDVRPDVKFE